MKTTIFLIFFLIISIFTFAQKPYFQQNVNYNIETELFPETATLKSFETIVYTNNSPDTLDYIYFNLWPNGYKNKHTALAKQMVNSGEADLFFHANKIGGYIDSLDFESDNKKLKWEYLKKYIDICIVYLNEPLFPGDSIEITTPFFVKLPEDISRMGYSDSAYQITQWYPKPAVYDNKGWHAMPYLNQGEFYSEFGTFDVFITLPKQQVVAATGNLQTPEELDWLLKLVETASKGYEIDNPSVGNKKTIHYHETNVHDFAWFCSENYYVNVDSVFTPRENRKVTTWTMFTDKNYFSWNKATDYVNAGVKYYSDWVGDYPFNNCTAVEGALSAGGGMEYPGVTVISVNYGIEDVIVHEVGHNWFYGILGFNERRYPMLDEGINSFYDHRYSYDIKKQMPALGMIPNQDNPKKSTQLTYLASAYFGMDQPADLTSTDYTKLTYGSIIYEKVPEMLIYLENYLGKNEFDSIMQGFYNEWKFKHPQPEDFESFVRNNSSKDVDWFFDGYIKTDGKADYSIKKKGKNLVIKNHGNFPAPVNIIGFKDDKAIDTFWLDPVKNKYKMSIDKSKYSHYIIDPYFNTMDFNRYNNYVKTKGLLKSGKKFKITVSAGLMDYYNKNLSFIPFIYYTRTSKFMIGSVITNANLPPKKFTYFVMPIYSFGYNDFQGSAYFMYKHLGYNGLPGVTYSLSIDRYPFINTSVNFIPSPFRKIKGQIVLDLKNEDASDRFSKKLTGSFILIPSSAYFLTPASTPDKSFISDRLKNFVPIYSLNFTVQKKSKFRPFLFTINADFMTNDYMLWAETEFKFHYTSLEDGIRIRLFSGSNVSATGTTGNTDYKYENFYWSRFDDYNTTNRTLWAHQFSNNYGGLTYYLPLQYNDFVNAINISTSIPKIPLIRLYYNFVSRADFTVGERLDALNFFEGLYETGVSFEIIPHIFSIYIPVYGSKTLMDYNNGINDKWYSHFRFTFKAENFKKFINEL